MTSPLLGSLASTIGKAFNGLFLDGSLTRTTTAAPDPQTPWDPGPQTPVSYPIKVIHDEWAAKWVADGLVDADDVKLLILSASCPVKPAVGDTVMVRGQTFTIGANGGSQPVVSTDPAQAVWVVRAKR